MSNRFKARLKQIRDASERRSVATQKARSSEDMERSQKTFQGFEFREKVEAIIGELVEGFIAEATGFELSRGFYEGKYLLALRTEELLTDEAGTTGSYYSRIVFLLDPHTTDDAFELQCRKTIRNRDLETSTHAAQMASDDLESISAFLEEQFVTFAERYFGGADIRRPTPAPS